MSTIIKGTEGKIELTDDSLILHGINRFQGAVVIPRGSISSVRAMTVAESTDTGLLRGLPALVITTHSGTVYKRHAKWNAYKLLAEFAAEVGAVVSR